jgi:5-methylcytosine-specific restriction endonuclease McrA
MAERCAVAPPICAYCGKHERRDSIWSRIYHEPTGTARGYFEHTCFCSPYCRSLWHAADRRPSTRQRGSPTKATRAEVYARDGWICKLCGGPITNDEWWTRPSLDHIVPASLGGAHTAENLRMAHMGCNVSRGARRDRHISPVASAP